MFYVTDKPPSDEWKLGRAYATAEEAERAARKWVKDRGTSTHIVFVPDMWSLTEVATVLKDSLGRIWTEVTHDGGRFL